MQAYGFEWVGDLSGQFEWVLDTASDVICGVAYLDEDGEPMDPSDFGGEWCVICDDEDEYGFANEDEALAAAADMARGMGVTAAFAGDSRVPEPVDSQDDRVECPLCGSDQYDGEFCPVCGYQPAPDGLDDIVIDDEVEVEEVDDREDVDRDHDEDDPVTASHRWATRNFTGPEIVELEREIEGRDLHNAHRLKDSVSW